MDFPSRAEDIAVCSALLFEAFLIVMGNLLTIFLFARQRKLRKKSLFLVINMAFADLMLGAVSLPVYVYLRIGFPQLWSITQDVWVVLGDFYLYFDVIFLQASLISAVFISCERFYAVYWPLKLRTLSTRAYAIVITVIWALAVLSTAVYISAILSSNRIGYSVSATILFSILIFILCGCNSGIWRKFQQRNNAFQQQNRAYQNRRLTKTLLFLIVSAAAVLSWVPYVIVEVHEVSVPINVYYPLVILNYSNSFFNPVVYTLKIPEFRQALVTCFSRHRAVGGTNNEATERENNRTKASGSTSLQAADP